MDPTMADSEDKMATIAGFKRLMNARDKKAALEQMGYGDLFKDPRFESMRFPDDAEREDASESGLGQIEALIERCGLTDICKPGSVSIDSVRDEATRLVVSIFQNFRFLGDVLDRHEATIHRRWLKKSNKWRLEAIRKAWKPETETAALHHSEMAASHRPDFEAIEREDEFKRLEDTKYRDSYLWPYVNEQDLCRPHSLLLLMSTRSRCHPSVLAATEHEAHAIGRRLMVFDFKSSGRYLIDLVTDGDEGCYGRLWSYESHPAEYVALETRSFTSPHYGLLVLEAQERVLSFLAKCARALLHDLAEDSLLRCPIVQFDLNSAIKNNAGYNSRAALTADAPYQQPTSLDFARIATLLATKHDDAADHLWSLREDPSYFEAHILEYKEHRRELLVDCFGRRHPILSPAHDDRFWGRVVGHQVYYAHSKLEVFADLRSQAEELRDMQSTYADVLSTTSDFPEPYTAEILQFRFHLEAATTSLIGELGQVWNASPPVRIYYRRKVEGDPTAQVEELEQNPSFNDDPIRARIYWLLSRLWTKDELFELLGLTNVVDELQRLVDSESGKRWISPYIDAVVSELSLVCECLHQLELYQPWADMHGHVSTARLSYLTLLYMRRSLPKMDLSNGVNTQDRVLGKLGAPTGGKFAYPVGKRRTRENVETMRDAEENLDKLWRKVDQDITSNADKFWNSIFKSGGKPEVSYADVKSNPLLVSAARRLLEGRTLQRTPAWTEPERGGSQTASSKLYVPFPEPSFDDQSPRGISGQQAKKKIKTRKLGTLEGSASETETIDPSSEVQTYSRFALNARALKVFRTLFFTASVTSTPGEVSWADLLYAMASVGFIPEKLYGSVWQFSPDPDKLAVGRSIQFHEPHGANNKIIYRVARRHGRRLNRAYGWDGSSFTLEEKSKQ